MAIRDAPRRAWERLRRLSPGAIDALLATFLMVPALLSTAGQGTDPDVVYEERDALAYALILGATLPYYVRRRAPLPVFLVSGLAVVALSLSGYNEGALPFVVLVGAYTVGAYRPVGEVVFGGAAMAVLLLALYFGDSPGFGVAELVSTSAVFGMAILMGWSMQSRRVRMEALEHEREEAALRAAADERLRIAQELHDVVAHSLGVIAVQAGVGMHVIDTDPDEARRALDHISRTSRSSLAEIRRLLGVVRNSEGSAAYTPAPGLADLATLVDDVGQAGLRVDLDVDADLTGVPAGVALTVYRIVQEALTNTLRHAGARRATVRVTAEEGAVRVAVADDGRGTNGAVPSGGHGLVGMRERVALYRGVLETGPAPGGGFRVAAWLPYEPEPAA